MVLWQDHLFAGNLQGLSRQGPECEGVPDSCGVCHTGLEPSTDATVIAVVPIADGDFLGSDCQSLESIYTFL